MNADSFEKEPASARSDTELTVTNEAQPPKAQVTLLLALIGVHRRPSVVPEGLPWKGMQGHTRYLRAQEIRIRANPALEKCRSSRH